MSDKNNFYDINQYADAMISKIVQFTKEEIKRTAIRIESAIVTNVHDDGSVDVVLPSDESSGFTKIQNQSAHPLKAGDAVEILLKNGSFNNCWIIAKHGAGVSSYNKDGSSTTFVNMGGGNGLIEEYTLPVASATVLGGVKIGSGLNMNNGVLSVSEIAIPVTSVNGKTGDIELTSTDIGLGNVANERQYSANNPPPYPVTSVNGQTGDVLIELPEIPEIEMPDVPEAASSTPVDVGKEAAVGVSVKYAREDHKHKGVTSVDGDSGEITTYAVKYDKDQNLNENQQAQARTNISAEKSGAAADVQKNLTEHINDKANPHEVTKAQVGLRNVENVKQYSDSNPPPYPVTSVNGQTGEVTIDIPEIPDIPKAATTPPKDISSTTSIGNSDKYAKEDHVHKGVVSVDGADGQVTTYAVKYNDSQSLTEEEKEQARNNIGAEQSGVAAQVQLTLNESIKAVSDNLSSHANNKDNPHEVTKNQVGLDNVANERQYSAENPPPYPVTSVDNLTGAVTTNSVKYTSQSLTNAQKTQARSNIGAGTSSFSGVFKDLSDIPDGLIQRAYDTSELAPNLGIDANTVNGLNSSYFTNIQISKNQPTDQRANDLWFEIT